MPPNIDRTAESKNPLQWSGANASSAVTIGSLALISALLGPGGPFRKFAHVLLSGGWFQWLALRPTIAHSRDQGVEIGTGELPKRTTWDACPISPAAKA
jgi:hypothetical protein